MRVLPRAESREVPIEIRETPADIDLLRHVDRPSGDSMTRTAEQVTVVSFMRLRVAGVAISAVLVLPLWALTDPVRTTSGPVSGSVTRCRSPFIEASLMRPTRWKSTLAASGSSETMDRCTSGN